MQRAVFTQGFGANLPLFIVEWSHATSPLYPPRADSSAPPHLLAPVLQTLHQPQFLTPSYHAATTSLPCAHSIRNSWLSTDSSPPLYSMPPTPAPSTPSTAQWVASAKSHSWASTVFYSETNPLEPAHPQAHLASPAAPGACWPQSHPWKSVAPLYHYCLGHCPARCRGGTVSAAEPNYPLRIYLPTSLVERGDPMLHMHHLPPSYGSASPRQRAARWICSDSNLWNWLPDCCSCRDWS